MNKDPELEKIEKSAGRYAIAFVLLVIAYAVLRSRYSASVKVGRVGLTDEQSKSLIAALEEFDREQGVG